MALAVGVSACERGCLSAWLSERAGPGATGERALGADGAGGRFDLAGTDCSDGLARCVGGRVETSVAGHIPYPCTPQEKTGACTCAWSIVAQCKSSCVKEGLVVAATGAVAIEQLCATAEPATRPLLPTEASSIPICAEESVSCVDGIVRSCAAPGQPARLVAACVSGCAAGIGLEPGDLGTSDGAATILCRRAHAERR